MVSGGNILGWGLHIASEIPLDFNSYVTVSPVDFFEFDVTNIKVKARISP